MTEMKFGIVTQVNPFRVQLDGDGTASEITYKRDSNYTPVVADRVYLLYDNGIYVVGGKIV